VSKNLFAISRRVFHNLVLLVAVLFSVFVIYSCNCICCLIVCGVSFIVCVDLCAVFCLSVVCYFV
jgi:hypothetical protein